MAVTASTFCRRSCATFQLSMALDVYADTTKGVSLGFHGLRSWPCPPTSAIRADICPKTICHPVVQAGVAAMVLPMQVVQGEAKAEGPSHA